MEPTIYRYVLRHSLRGQIVLVALTLISFPFLYASLDLPKTIINQAIGGHDFPKTVYGVAFTQIELLLALCAIFLGLVLVNGAFKYAINVYKGHLAERTLRRLRYDLFSRVLRFPLPHFRRLSQGEVVAMITSESEPLGGFIGDAFELPAFQGGTLLTILVFMFVQDPVLGLAAVALYPLQAILIPRLQRRVNELGKQRIRAVRRLAERISETVAGIETVRANDAFEYERADFAERAGRIYEIRYRIYILKFLIKFLNNFLAQVTPFFFFSIGGYLVIRGDLTFGALVAVLAAYKDLSAPWRELLGFYQEKEDARIKYEQLVDQFHPAGMLDEALARPEPGPTPPLDGPLTLSRVSLEEDGGIKVVDGVSLVVALDEHLAIVGPSGAGRAALARLIARLATPTGGSILIGARDIARAPQSLIGRRIAFADQTTHLFAGSILDNLVYGLKSRPLREAVYDGPGRARRERAVAEALLSGNTPSDPAADWIDHEAAEIANPDALGDRILAVLRAVELDHDVYELGLHGTVDPATRPGLAAAVLEARRRLRAALAAPPFATLVEPFDRDRYNGNMTVAENLLFGFPRGADLDLDRLGENPHVLAVLADAGLIDDFLRTGLRVAAVMVDLFRDLPPGHEYFERYSFVGAEALAELAPVIRRAETTPLAELAPGERQLLISLPFKLIAERHRLGLLDRAMQDRLVAARRLFVSRPPTNLAAAIAFLDADQYNPAASVLDNILFGKLVYGRSQARAQVGALIETVIDDLGLRREIVALGLGAAVGIGGGRLTVAQRQKVALARCLLKRPDLLVVNDALAALDPAAQASILANVRADMRGRAIVWVLSHAELARPFDRVAVMEAGHLVEEGRFADLNRPGSRLHKLLGKD